MLVINGLIFFYVLKMFIYLFIRYRKKKEYKSVSTNTKIFSVEIILPMYNEKKVILETIRNILRINYDNFLITVIDDGSTDGCLEIVRSHFHDCGQIKILHQKNKGKSAALNYAVGLSEKDIIICIDADTLVKPDIIEKVLPYFDDDNVAAVSGNIKVGNRDNLITNLQYIEYITNPNYERIIFESVNGILVVPGAIGAFRSSVIKKIGGYADDTLTEDSDITLRILCNNYIIRNAPDVMGYTEAPASPKAFFNQRVRWKVGTIQVLIKYRKAVFLNKNKALPYLVIPYTWIFGVVLPILTPISDYIFFYYISILHNVSIMPNYLLFIFLDAFICSIILISNKESKQIFYIIFQRFLLRHLILVTYFKIVFKLIKGGLFKWENSVRYGSTRIE